MPDGPHKQRNPGSAPPAVADDAAARANSPTGQVLARAEPGALWAHMAARRAYGGGGNAEQDPEPQDRVEP